MGKEAAGRKTNKIPQNLNPTAFNQSNKIEEKGARRKTKQNLL